MIGPPLKLLGLLSGGVVFLSLQASDLIPSGTTGSDVVQTILTVAAALGLPLVVKAWWEHRQRRADLREDSEAEEIRRLRHDNNVLGRYAERAYALAIAAGAQLEPPPVPTMPGTLSRTIQP